MNRGGAARLAIPPLGMSTGFSMFAMHAFRVPWTWGLSAFVLGAALFAQPVIATSRLTREGNVIMMRRSPWFIVIIPALAAIRLALRAYGNHHFTATDRWPVLHPGVRDDQVAQLSLPANTSDSRQTSAPDRRPQRDCSVPRCEPLHLVVACIRNLALLDATPSILRQP